jgi:hypothetical protein
LKLVYEDKFGAYLGVRPEFLKKFVPVEINPNFDVYDSKNGYHRFIVAKCSRIPDDEDLTAGRFGIDFMRGKPTLTEALEYEAVLPGGYQWLGDIAFAAKNREEYSKKAAVWDSFYSFIWDTKPQTIWVAPHSGSVDRPPDEFKPFPKFMIDMFSAGVAALCAYHDASTASKRVMISVHGTGLLGGVLNLGDFGVLNLDNIGSLIKKIEAKYHRRVQSLAKKFKRDYCLKTLRILENINQVRGTLDPDELEKVSLDDSGDVKLQVKSLKYYGQEIKKYTLDEFKEALGSLGSLEVPIITINYLYSARKTGKILKVFEKIENGFLSSALLVESAKLYMAKNPEMVADIILDVKKELFS